jgi:hypothetical protein
MRKLTNPRRIKTRTGPVEATHELHEFHVHLRPGNEQIVSTKTPVVQVDANDFVPLDDNTETVIISGSHLKALGSDFKVSDVLAKHEEIMAHTQGEREKAAREEHLRLQKELADTEKRLAELKARL